MNFARNNLFHRIEMDIAGGWTQEHREVVNIFFLWYGWNE
jgi:hypothetical protein